jgi:hypothetical protein
MNQLTQTRNGRRAPTNEEKMGQHIGAASWPDFSRVWKASEAGAGWNPWGTVRDIQLRG